MPFGLIFEAWTEHRKPRLDCVCVDGLHVGPSQRAPFPELFVIFVSKILPNGFQSGFVMDFGSNWGGFGTFVCQFASP